MFCRVCSGRFCCVPLPQFVFEKLPNLTVLGCVRLALFDFVPLCSLPVFDFVRLARSNSSQESTEDKPLLQKAQFFLQKRR